MTRPIRKGRLAALALVLCGGMAWAVAAQPGGHGFPVFAACMAVLVALAGWFTASLAQSVWRRLRKGP